MMKNNIFIWRIGSRKQKLVYRLSKMSVCNYSKSIINKYQRLENAEEEFFRKQKVVLDELKKAMDNVSQDNLNKDSKISEL